MAGHSKWHQIKRKKGVTDAKRGQAFTKLGKNISVAARLGGGDPEMNPSLKLAIEKAKAANMPNDNITRAVKAGTGELKDAKEIHELMYDAYAPGGVALYIRALTDNRNRTVASIREVFTKNGGSLGESGSVSYQFKRQLAITIQLPAQMSEEDLELLVIEADGSEVRLLEDGVYEIFTDPEKGSVMRSTLEAQGIAMTEYSIVFVPQTTIEITDIETAKAIIHVVELLEDDEDVDAVFSNFELAEGILDHLA